jgi:hypothetical protein
LDLINDLINSAKENNLVQGFVKELGEFLEKGVLSKELSSIEQIQNSRKVTTKYRDKMYLERNNILNNYAKETANRGTMYYIYSENLGKEISYNVSICEESKSHEVIEVSKDDLPEGAKVDSVLRMQNGKYVLDNEATEEISNEISQMIDNLLENQSQELEEKRIDGHVYEVGEKESDRVLLFDTTQNDARGSEGIEEIDFPKELLNEVEEGSLVEYKNGSYQIYEN